MMEQSATLTAAEEAAKQNRILELRGRLSSIRKKKSIVDDGDDSTSTSSATTDTEDALHRSPPINVNSTITSPTVDDDSDDDISDDGSTDSTMSTGSAASSIMFSGSGYDPDSFMAIDKGSLDDSFKEMLPSDDQYQEKPKGVLDSFLESKHRDRDNSRSSEKENRDCCSKDKEPSDVSSKEPTKSKRWEEKSRELRQLRIAKMKERNKQRAAEAAQVNQQPQAKPSPSSRPCVNNNNNNNAPFVSKIHKYKKLMSGTDLYSETIRREAQRVLAQVKISHLVNEAKRIIQEADQQKAMKILLQGGDSNQVCNSTLLTTIYPNMLPPCLYDMDDGDTSCQVDELYYKDDTLSAVSDEAVASQEEHMVSNEEAATSTKRKHDTLETIAHIRRQCSLEEVQFEVEMILHAVEDILKSRKGRIAWMKRKRLLLSVHHEDKDTELKMQVKHLKSTLQSTDQDEKASKDIQLDDALKIMSDCNDMDVYEDDDNSFFAIGRDGILSGNLLDIDTDDTVHSKKKMRIKNPSWTKIRRMRRKSEVSKATSTTTEGTVEMDDSSRSETQELDCCYLLFTRCVSSNQNVGSRRKIRERRGQFVHHVRMIPREEDEDIDSIMPNIRKGKECIKRPSRIDKNKLATLDENEPLEACARKEAKRILAAVRESEERRREIKRIQDVSDQEVSVHDKKHYSSWLKMNPKELRTEAKRILEAVDNAKTSCIQNIGHESNQSIPEENNPNTGRLNPIGSRFLQIESTGWFARSSGWI